MNQTLRQYRALREMRRTRDSDIHRTVEWCRDIAPDLLGGLLILPLTVLFVVELYGLVLLAQGAM